MTDPSYKDAGLPSRWHRAWPDVLGVSWVVLAGVALLGPALAHGSHLGPYDVLSQYGLSKQPGIVPHATWNGDQIDAIDPWTSFASLQVHQGQIPLWNPYGGLGMPLAFNWQTAPFGIAALIGYLAPVQFAYTVSFVVTIIVAGTGAYFLGKTLRLGVLGCAMVGTTFELGGPFVGWLGWPHASVMAWAGWMFGAAILILRGGHRARNVALLAIVLAFAIYAGQPLILAVLLISFCLFLVVLLIQRAFDLGLGTTRRPIMDLVMALAAGAALGAPFALPGFQLAARSVNSTAFGQRGFSPQYLLYLVFQGFDGLPISGSRLFGPLPWYVAAYVGVIALVMVGLAVAMRRRSSEIRGFVVVALVAGGAAFIPYVTGVSGGEPPRSLLPMAFALAVLSGIGLDALVRTDREQVWRWTAAAFAGAVAVLAVIFVVSIGSLPAGEDSIRTRSFIWPAASAFVGLAAAGACWYHQRDRHAGSALPQTKAVVDGERSSSHPLGGDEAEPLRTTQDGVIATTTPKVRRRVHFAGGAGFVMLACETAFLIAAGAPLLSSSPTFFTATSAEMKFQRIVGSSLVGWGGLSAATSLCNGLGIMPNTNDVFYVHELALYDPMAPRSDFTSYRRLTGRSAGYIDIDQYCPPITSMSLAHLYGVSYILEPAGTAGPQGTTLVTRLGDEDLYHVAGSSRTTLTPLLPDGMLPPITAPGKAIANESPDPTSWNLTVEAPAPAVLRFRLTDVPGWHASIDGKPLALDRYSGVMLQARVPPGRHTIELHYWPDTFNVGLALAAISAICLAAALIVEGSRHRKVLNP